MFTDENDHGGRRRTWIVARIDRSSWLPENERELFDVPDRSEGLERDHVAPNLRPPPAQKALRRREVRQYSDADVLAMSMHGQYKLVEIILMRSDRYDNMSLRRVKAVCTGGYCNGSRAVFSLWNWFDQRVRLGCPVCAKMHTYVLKREERKKVTNQTHGHYVLAGFESTTSHKLAVRGRCIGGLCDGHERVFGWKAWQESEEGRRGCIKCSAPERTKNAGVVVGSLEKLDAAAREMRELEERVAS